MFAEVRPTRGSTVTSARFTETRRVFEEALTHADANRWAFLQRRCAHDDGLLRDVQSLLEANARVGGTRFIEEAIEAAVQDLRSERVDGWYQSVRR